MAENANRTSSLYREGASPNTRAIVSSRVRILTSAVGDTKKTQVGQIATFDPSESRGVDPIRGIGYGDVVAELVPSVTEPMTVSITRSALYLENVFQSFGYKGGAHGLVRSLRHHTWPFDVKQEIAFAEEGTINETNDNLYSQITQTAKLRSLVAADTREVKALITFYVGCWMNSWSTSYSSDTYLVQENIDLTVTDVVGTDLDTAGMSPIPSDNLTREGQSDIFG